MSETMTGETMTSGRDLAQLSPEMDRGAARESRAPRVAGRLTTRLGRRLLPALLLILAVGGGYFAWTHLKPSATDPTAAAAPPTVTVSPPLKHRLATWSSFTGQFSAVDRVEIRAQVSGYLTEIRFKDGQLVKKGDLLFVVDPRPYEIALANARAQLDTAKASLELSKKQLDRTSYLLRSEYASRETMDQRTQAQKAADASLDQAKAAVRKAELDMEWTHIVAPISGRISTRRVSIGNLISGGQAGGGAATMLTTIVSLDPIYLDFDMGEGDFVAYQRYLHRSQASQPGAKQDPKAVDKAIDKTVEIALTDETGWKHRGSLDFLDNEVDRSSGTIHARATVPNRDLFIAAGQFARLRVPTASPAERLLLPEAALSTDQNRTLVMTVDKDGNVVPKPIEIGAQVGELRIVKRGLTSEDRVIINGLMFARPGGKVTPKPGAFALPPDEG